MDLRVYYQKIRKIRGYDSRAFRGHRQPRDSGWGQGGGRDRRSAELGRRLIVEDRAELASPEKRRSFGPIGRGIWREAEEAEDLWAEVVRMRAATAQAPVKRIEGRRCC